jgi:threonine aldolase
LEELKKSASEDLFIQIELYEKCQLEDEQEAFSKNGLDMNNPLDVFNAVCLKNQNFKNVNQKFLELLQFVYQMSEFHGENNNYNNNNNNNTNASSQMETLFAILSETARDLMLKTQQKYMIKLHSDAHTQTDELGGPKLKSVINNVQQSDFSKLKLNPVNLASRDGPKKVFPTISKVI